jgi:hypothetical protein
MSRDASWLRDLDYSTLTWATQLRYKFIAGERLVFNVDSSRTGLKMEVYKPTNIRHGFVDEAADAGGVSVKALLGTAGVSDNLAARVAAADADGSGVLSLAELVSVFRSEADAVKDKRVMRRCDALALS